jgi:putative addiction module antidote
MNKPLTHSKALKLVAIGNSTGVILPKELLNRLGVTQGDVIALSETPDGIELRRYEADFEEQMAVARDVMKRRRAALRELAK